MIPFPGLIRERWHGGEISGEGDSGGTRGAGASRGSTDRGEADRGRAILLTLAGWTSARIAQAFGVREDTVRLWRSAFLAGSVAALRKRVAVGPAPVKSQAALRVVGPLLSAPVADRNNWTLAPCRRDRGARGAQHFPVAAFKNTAPKRGFRFRRPRHSLKNRQDAEDVERTGLRLQLLKRQAEAGDIVLLFGDESDAHPSLSGALLGKARRRLARSRARTGEEGRHDGCFRLGRAG